MSENKEPTLIEVMEELKRTKNELKKEIEKSRLSMWLTPAAFGASIALFGLSYLARLTTGTLNIWESSLIITAAGMGFMFFALRKVKEAERKYENKWKEPPRL